INNDGISDAGTNLAASYPSDWANFTDDLNNDDNDGFGSNGGVGFRTGSLPYYTMARKQQQGSAVGVTDGDWRRDPRFLNHLGTGPHNIGAASTRRMVYEPFLNFDYPEFPGNAVVGWDGQESSHGPRVDWRASGDPVDNDGGVTTRARDPIGGQMELEVSIDGIFYCEGTYSGTGNLKVYGSLLMRGG